MFGIGPFELLILLLVLVVIVGLLVGLAGVVRRDERSAAHCRDPG